MRPSVSRWDQIIVSNMSSDAYLTRRQSSYAYILVLQPVVSVEGARFRVPLYPTSFKWTIPRQV